MGGAVSSGESNDDLIDNLLEADYIKSPLVERVFRAVDRAFYYTEPYKANAYKDLAWKDGNLHLSAPCIYSEVLENLELRAGMCFLNIGSGTGYFSTMCGLILGKTGVNHGIELYPDVVEYAQMKLEEFLKSSPAIDEFDFCPPEFTVGNCLDSISTAKRYDRIYCGAACPSTYIESLVDMLKVGGVCVVPMGDSLIQITRTDEKKDDRKTLLPVSFASLISPKDADAKTPVELPELSPRSLAELCRSEIRSSLRQTINFPEPRGNSDERRKKKRKRRQEERRQARRLVVVQRRRSGGVELGDPDGGNGFVAVAYSMGSNSSDDEVNRGSQDDNTTTSSEDSSQEGEARTRINEVESIEAIMEEENREVEEESSADNGSKVTGSSNGSDGNAVSESRDGGVAVVTGSCSVFAVSNNGKKGKATDNGVQNTANGTTTSRNGHNSSSVSPRPVNGASTARTSRRNCTTTTGAASLMGRIQQLVRARQHDLEFMRRQFRRTDTDTRSNSDNQSEAGDESVDATVHAAASTSSSDSSPSHYSPTSSSEEDNVTGKNQCDNSKKRCRHESTDEDKGNSAKEPKADPLLINPCSVQMRRKIIELPLPPALKVYLNYNRKILYS